MHGLPRDPPPVPRETGSGPRVSDRGLPARQRDGGSRLGCRALPGLVLGDRSGWRDSNSFWARLGASLRRGGGSGGGAVAVAASSAAVLVVGDLSGRSV